MQAILRNKYFLAALNTQFRANRMKNAVRFESQNVSWDHEELNFQSVAFSKGLASLDFTHSTTYLNQMITSSSESHQDNNPRLTSPN